MSNSKVPPAISGNDTLLKTINELLSYIHQINFDDEYTPEFEMFADSDINTDLAARDEKLSGIGVRFTKKYFQEKYE